jgi:hypothetical protein
MSGWLCCMTALAVLCGTAPALAATRSSGELAKELVALLDQRQLQSVAARLPDQRDRFVAVLHIPKSELLVVSAQYTVPVLLQEQIYQGKYRDAYVALNSSGSKTGKLFVEDTGADGLALAPNENGRFDVVYREVSNQTLLNGDWKGQKLSEQEYKHRFDAAEAEYARALSALIEELKKAS